MCVFFFFTTAERDEGLGRSKEKELNTISTSSIRNSELSWLSQKWRGQACILVADNLMFRIKFTPDLFVN